MVASLWEGGRGAWSSPVTTFTAGVCHSIADHCSPAVRVCMWPCCTGDTPLLYIAREGEAVQGAFSGGGLSGWGLFVGDTSSASRSSASRSSARGGRGVAAAATLCPSQQLMWSGLLLQSGARLEAIRVCLLVFFFF